MAYRMLHRLNRASRRTARRRGAVLLIVLTLLVLFVLIGVTFVLVSTKYNASARVMSQEGQQGDPPRKLFEEAMIRLMVGPKVEAPLGNVQAPFSCLWQQDILGDLYGKDGVICTVTGAGAPDTVGTAGQFFAIPIAGIPPTLLSNEAGEYAGRVLTVIYAVPTGGPSPVGLSSRITGYVANGANAGTVYVEAFKTDTGFPVATIPAGSQVLINGACFNGTGAGYIAGGTLGYQRATAYGYPMALMPNFSRYDNSQWMTIRGFANNEPYDAVDFQNMFLAKVATDGIYPSFHRPDLVNYWMQTSSWGTDSLLRARVMFRPDDTVHTNFTGSNPSVVLGGQKFNPVNGPWDIDNDNDGTPDSIWIDIGLPARAGRDGRMYKPLVAVLIRDLDGRFDVNAHGNLAQVMSGGSYAAGTSAYYPPAPALANPTTTRGVGFGPAGINFGHITGNYNAVLQGRYSAGAEGANPGPGVLGTNDPLSIYKDILRPTNYAGGAAGGYGSPSDVWDQGTVGIDVAGHPIYQLMSTGNERVDDPYELNIRKALDQGLGSVDQAYTLAELEAVLRRFDADAYKLSPRLMNLMGANSAHLVTVLSSHIPAHAGNLPPSRRGNENHLHGLLERYGITDPNQLVQLVPTEVLKGGKMNVNRPFGNGLDDNGNGAIDEPAEGYEKPFPGGLVPNATSAVTDYKNFGQVNSGDAPGTQYLNRLMARQLYARQLYMLAMALTDPTAFPPTVEVGLNQNEYRSRRLAQWAVNCVDYRDSDGIMTPFEYDADISGAGGGTAGWQTNIDGNPATDEGGDRRIVWGCEYPDLLMTEVFGCHNKELKDTKLDPNAKELKDKDGNMMQVEKTLDQFQVPQGSLFVEFYCPRAPQAVAGVPGGNAILPRELYSNGSALDLGKTSPNGDPVWRLVISKPHAANNSAYNISQLNPDSAQFQPEAMIMPNIGVAPQTLLPDRYVFFTAGLPGGADQYGNNYADVSYYRQGGGANLLPGQYAVVGPRALTVFGENRDGTATTLATLAAQRIAIAGASVTVTGAGGGPVTNNNVLGIICQANVVNGYPRSGMNASEPLPQTALYYGSPAVPSETPPTKTLYPELGQIAYDDPTTDDPNTFVPDKPFDYKGVADGLAGSRPLFANNMTNSGTYQNHRTVFLQRLADPTIPFNALGNPYITVDWKPLDLTVFNGSDRQDLHTDLPAGFVYDDYDNNPNWTTPPNMGQVGTSSGTRESGNAQYNLWTNATVPPAPSAGAGGAIFNYSISNTFGTLNRPMIVNASLVGAPFPYNQAPTTPFPWLKIPNRPFVSAYELMDVPASAPGRLLTEVSLGNLGGDPYNGVDVTNYRAPYGHLLNFLRTSPAPVSGAMPTPAANLHRIFDYLEVPSQYAGAETWYNTDTFGNAPANSPAEFYRPPFNFLSRYQDPGLVNINTIFESTIWDAGNGYGGVCGGRGPNWGSLRLSRQGFPDGSESSYPAKFANPFRPGWCHDCVPMDNMLYPEVDVTLMRRPTPGSGNSPLFAGTGQTNTPWNDTTRHSGFRYEPLVAIGNRVKFTSNVFAVWMTVGFFEVEQVNPGSPPDPNWQQIMPDGWKLGPELGVDTGEITRHRAFYIIDRSIPVAYQPGEAHNTERCILLRRYLE